MHPLMERAKENLGIRDARETYLEYSGRFTKYNGNARATRLAVEIRLSKDWRDRDEDVQLGIIEHLLAKIFRKKIKTPRMQLYQDFLLYVGREAEPEVEDARLMASFERVNKKYFGGSMELPSIRWGRQSFARIGYYHYASDTVTLSTVLLDNQHMLDFVLYHELLHKKHGLTKGGIAHTKAFKRDEALFEEATEAELHSYVRKAKRSLF